MIMMKMEQLNENATGLLPMPNHPPPAHGQPPHQQQQQQQQNHHPHGVVLNHNSNSSSTAVNNHQSMSLGHDQQYQQQPQHRHAAILLPNPNGHQEQQPQQFQPVPHQQQQQHHPQQQQHLLQGQQQQPPLHHHHSPPQALGYQVNQLLQQQPQPISSSYSTTPSESAINERSRYVPCQDLPVDDDDYTNADVPSPKIVISGIPLHAQFGDIEPLLKPYGTVIDCDAVTSKDPNTQTIHITFDTLEQAQRAAGGLNGVEFRGRNLQAESLDRQRQRAPQRPRAGAYAQVAGSTRPADFPLRMLVQSDMVGAIIGRQGTTIRQITQQTRARVDVHRKDNVGSLEKAITVYGNPDNCTNACRRILEVMQQEANNTNKGEIHLKILAHNNLIGRIIGKSGNTIKRIMQETDTRVTVSSINDINSFNLERIITVKGDIPNMSRAENMISSKLRTSFENDLSQLAPQTVMFPGLHPMTIMSTNNNMQQQLSAAATMSGAPLSQFGAAAGRIPAFPGVNYPLYQSPGVAQPGSSDVTETAILYIQNAAVGAIIGTKGSHIRNIIRFSAASVKIAPMDTDRPVEPNMERRVTVIGSPEAQWKAQFLISEKLREEGFTHGQSDTQLVVEINVASSQVGRIIGKGGQNVRELQRVTGSAIKLPEHGLTPPADEETTVQITGPFFSVQSAQRRIRAMMMSTNPPPVPRRAAATLRLTAGSPVVGAGAGGVGGAGAGTTTLISSAQVSAAVAAATAAPAGSSSQQPSTSGQAQQQQQQQQVQQQAAGAASASSASSQPQPSTSSQQQQQ